jgi:hypothetical protein
MSSIEDRIASINQSLSDATQERMETTAQLLSKPDDAALNGQLDALDAEIAENNKMLKRFSDAQVEAKRLNTDAAKAERYASTRSICSNLLAKMLHRVTLDAKIDAVMADKLGPLLSERHALNAELHDDWKAFQRSRSTRDAKYPYEVVALVGGSSGRHCSALKWNLWAAGIGRVGVINGEAAKRPDGQQYGLADASKAAVDQVTAATAAILEREVAA